MQSPPLHHETIAHKSAIAPHPKSAFVDWIGSASASHPLKWKAEQILQSREPIVWIIPSLGSFSSQEAIDVFIESYKVPMLSSELVASHVDEKLWPALSVETFNKFFELQIYDHVASIKHLTQAEQGAAANP